MDSPSGSLSHDRDGLNKPSLVFFKRGFFVSSVRLCSIALVCIYNLVILLLEEVDLNLEINTSHSWLMQGVALAQAQDYFAAAAAFEQAKTIDPGNVQAWRNLGAALKQIGVLPSQRIACYEQALRLEEDPYTYANLAAALLDAGDWSRAANTAQKACELLPDYFVAWLNLGHALAFTGEVSAAQTAYQKALKLEPQNADALHGLGALLQQCNQHEEAAAMLGQAEAVSTNSHKIGTLAMRARQQIADWSRRDQDESSLKSWITGNCIGIPPFNTLAFDSLSGLDLHNAAQIHATHEFKEMLVEPSLWSSKYRSLDKARLRVGYLTADLRSHVMGRLMGSVLQASGQRNHDATVYDIYPDEQNTLRSQIEPHITSWKNIAQLSWRKAAEVIAADEIDVLVDMTGYTAHGRTGILAYRPSPVQVNFLGYPASLGHRQIADYVLADEVVVPDTHFEHFAEQVVWLKGSFMPPVRLEESLPSRQRAEFGLPDDAFVLAAFHNGYKLTPTIFADWMWLLQQLPKAVLWLLAPSVMMQKRLLDKVGEAGIDVERIIFYQGGSYIDYLSALSVADLFLDAQPYGAGGTSRDVLLVGVPMVTVLGDRMCGRMAASVCIEQGVPECVAPNREEYRSYAMNLANNEALRADIKARLLAQRPLAQVRINEYAHQLDVTFQELAVKYQLQNSDRLLSIANETNFLPTMTPMIRTFLHVGCGHKRKDKTTQGFNCSEWQELRLDIDPAASPDIVGTMIDMSGVADASVDAIYSSHNIEHLYPHEVPKALTEFMRVLKQDGFLVITCPDLQSVCSLIAEDKLFEAAYTSPAGPIAPIDILYGHRSALAQGNLYMAHRCGFTERVLISTLRGMGFLAVISTRRGAPFYDLFAVATKLLKTEAEMRSLAAEHFPK